MDGGAKIALIVLALAGISFIALADQGYFDHKYTIVNVTQQYVTMPVQSYDDSALRNGMENLNRRLASVEDQKEPVVYSANAYCVTSNDNGTILLRCRQMLEAQ